jgi:hypothetical protein
MALDSDSGSKLSDKAVLENFRSGTTPNPYGEFRDNGEYVGRLLQEADTVISLLSSAPSYQAASRFLGSEDRCRAARRTAG